MPLNTRRKETIKTALLLELNNAFVKIAKHFKEQGDPDEIEYLHALETSIRECVEGKPEGQAA